MRKPNYRFERAERDRATFSQPINTMPRLSRTPATRDARPPWTISVVDAEKPPPSRADQHHVGGSIATRPHRPLVPDPEAIESS